MKGNLNFKADNEYLVTLQKNSSQLTMLLSNHLHVRPLWTSHKSQATKPKLKSGKTKKSRAFYETHLVLAKSKKHIC